MENRVANLAGDSWSVVVDGNQGLAGPRDQRQTYPCFSRAMDDRVFKEVSEYAGQQFEISPHWKRAFKPFRNELDARMRLLKGPTDCRQERCQVELLEGRGHGRGVNPGEHQELAHQRCQPRGLTAHGGEGALVFDDTAGLGERDIDARLQGGKRGPQLVRRVGGEPSLALNGFTNPLDHMIERRGEFANFISRINPRDAFPQVSAGDAVGGRRDRRDWPESPARDEKGARGKAQAGGRHGGKKDGAENGERLFYLRGFQPRDKHTLDGACVQDGRSEDAKLLSAAVIERGQGSRASPANSPRQGRFVRGRTGRHRTIRDQFSSRAVETDEGHAVGPLIPGILRQP